MRVRTWHRRRDGVGAHVVVQLQEDEAGRDAAPARAHRRGCARRVRRPARVQTGHAPNSETKPNETKHKA